MIETCSYNDCCGCMACIDICPRKAICVRVNEYGESIPTIDQNLCIDCGLCKRVCPQIEIHKNLIPEKCFAAFAKDKQKRADSASGGIARLLYEAFLNSEASLVYGVEFNDDIKAIYTCTDDSKAISRYQGSKYVQPDSNGLFEQISKELSENKRVLFISSPCVIMAAYNYLKTRKIPDDLFYTGDILCHGVSPEPYLHEELEFLKKKHHWKSIEHVTFRSNRKFRNFHLVVSATNNKDKKILYNRYSFEDPYFSAFLDGTTLREGCYHCKYSSPERVGDITIGDFIGLGEIDGYSDVPFNTYNNSLIIVNTSKGEELFNSVQSEITVLERPFAEAYVKGTSFQKPFSKSETRDYFLKYYPSYGFMRAIIEANGSKIKKSSKFSKFTRPLKQLLIKIKS